MLLISSSALVVSSRAAACSLAPWARLWLEPLTCVAADATCSAAVAERAGDPREGAVHPADDEERQDATGQDGRAEADQDARLAGSGRC
jgi:hypothetical protein